MAALTLYSRIPNFCTVYGREQVCVMARARNGTVYHVWLARVATLSQGERVRAGTFTSPIYRTGKTGRAVELSNAPAYVVEAFANAARYYCPAQGV